MPGEYDVPAAGDCVIVNVPGGRQLSVAITFAVKSGTVAELAVTDRGAAQDVITGAMVSGVASMVTSATAIQPLASVTVNDQLPAVRSKLPVPVYGARPPVAETETVVERPQETEGAAVAEAWRNVSKGDKL